jgi:diguanylate cyclase (GGDEF)-like protein
VADVKSENRALRRQLRDFTAEARHNEILLRRSLDRELKLLGTESLGELLSALSDGLRVSFGLAAASLLLVDEDHRLRHLLRQADLSPSMFPQVLFVDRPEELGPVVASLRRPRLGAFQERLHRALFPGQEGLRSVALLPLLRNRLLGSINLGSDDPGRYTHRHASDFLHRLGVIGALCLENAANREQLVISGHTDPLTGLKNRRYLEMRLREELATARRYHQPLSCLFIDADHFKSVNDRFGHDTGDQALQALGACLESQLRASDVAVRYGGEEFAVLLPRTGGDDALLLAERIRAEVSELELAADSGEAVRLSVSIGVNTVRLAPAAQEVEAFGELLLGGADGALYRAKREGRNRVVWCQPDCHPPAQPPRWACERSAG